MAKAQYSRASVVQDFWIGAAPRLHARRFAPWHEADARVRIAFHLDVGRALDEPVVSAFLETLGARVDVVALEPRSGHRAPELGDLFRKLLDVQWRDELPLVVAGHGIGAIVATAAADHPRVRAVVALAPETTPAVATSHPLLLVRGSEETGLAGPSHRTTLVIVSEPRAATLAPPWPEIVAAWASTVAGH